jgi:hypothetical protein
LDITLDQYYQLSNLIGNTLVSYLGNGFINRTDLLIITNISQGSVILSFIINIPIILNPTQTYTNYQQQLTSSNTIAGAPIIAISNFNLIMPNPPVTPITPSSVVYTTDNSKNTIIIAAVVVPSAVIILFILGFCLRKYIMNNRNTISN